MTTPTQAQIEAELTGIDLLKLQFERNHWRITHRVDGKDMSSIDYDLVTKAITAAAQVDDRHPLVDEDWPHLKASAQVEELQPTPDCFAADIETATIERCAQMAENYSNAKPGDISEVMAGDWQYAIAAAIRKLKDEAAQVGEQKPKIVATLTPGMLNLIEADRRATIERCAQVAETYDPTPYLDRSMREGIATAIRKLKDEPNNMTTPTQAQIEAAEREIGRLKTVIRVNALRWGHTDEEIDKIIGAAAQVWKPMTTDPFQIGWDTGFKDAVVASTKEINATIDRCKQVVEDILGPSDPRTPEGYDVLIALEKLKDEI